MWVKKKNTGELDKQKSIKGENTVTIHFLFG